MSEQDTKPYPDAGTRERERVLCQHTGCSHGAAILMVAASTALRAARDAGATVSVEKR